MPVSKAEDILTRLKSVNGALALAAALSSGAVAAQDPLPDLGHYGLNYVNRLQAPSTWYCRSTPQDSANTSTVIQIRIQIDAQLNAVAYSRFSADIDGKEYAAYINWTGRAQPLANSRARLQLETATLQRRDTLPEGLEWSDPEGDALYLDVVSDDTSSGRPYMLRGAEVSEHGTSDVTCIALLRK